MKKVMSLFLVTLLIISNARETHSNDKPSGAAMKSIYDFMVKDIDGKEVKLDQFKGSVMLIVNVASKCGFTSQYEGLQNLYSTYKERGLVILGFPANNFWGRSRAPMKRSSNFVRLITTLPFRCFPRYQ